MARFSHYEACPKCRDKGNDNRGDNLAVYSDGGAHCFSCGYHQHPKHYVRAEKETVNVNANVRPADFSREVPARAWGWLLQYGLPMSYWTPFVGWTEKDQRLVFTEAEFSIGRDMALSAREDGRPRRKWFVWGNCHQTPHVYGDYSNSKEVVLVEDLISGHKLGRVTCSLPLFGTKVFGSVIPCLRHIGLPVVMWLDKDQEGMMPKRADQLQQLIGLPVRYVTTREDPKLLSFDSIRKTLDI